MAHTEQGPTSREGRTLGCGALLKTGPYLASSLCRFQEPLPRAAAVLARRFGLTAATAALVVELAGIAEGRP